LKERALVPCPRGTKLGSAKPFAPVKPILVWAPILTLPRGSGPSPEVTIQQGKGDFTTSFGNCSPKYSRQASRTARPGPSTRHVQDEYEHQHRSQGQSNAQQRIIVTTVSRRRSGQRRILGSQELVTRISSPALALTCHVSLPETLWSRAALKASRKRIEAIGLIIAIR
jgi:hypothetical protein